MKRSLLYAMLAAVFFVNTASMCSSDDDSPSSSQNANDVINTVSSGTWRVTNFNEDGVDHTSYFTNFNFTFGASNVLTATNGSDTHVGVWSVTNDDSNDDSPSSSGVDFNIFFASPNNFTEISEDWDILERTSTKIRLKHVSGGDGSVDLLTFEKN